MNQSICIIGFGISGISCTRWAKEIGLQIHVLESSNSFGGCWYHKNYQNVQLQTTKYSYAFSDMPMDDSYQLHPNHQEVMQYLEKYCTHHNLFKYVSFNHTVLKITYDNKWEIRYYDRNQDKMNSLFTDYIAICSGLYSTPNIPDFAKRYLVSNNRQYPIFKHPKIKLYHSYQFSSEQKLSPHIFRGKKVVIIGNGPTGCDLATLACENCSASVHILFRTDRWIFTRKSGIINNYFYTNRFMFMIAKYISFIIIIVWLKIMFYFGYYSGGYTKKIDQPNTIITRNNIALSDSIYEYINQKKIIYHKTPKINITDHSCTYTHKNVTYDLKPDIVILSTGYSSNFPYLGIKTIPHLYRRIIHPSLPNCGFIGFSASFNWVQVSDMQSRWFMKYIQGEINIPRKKEMIQSIRNSVYQSKSNPYEYNDLTYIAYDYMDQLANDVNIQPKKKWLSVAKYDDWSGF